MRKHRDYFLAFIIIMGLASTIIFAQEKPIKRIRAELKLGMPNLFGFCGEYQTPVFDNSLAPYIDFSKFTLALDENVDFGFSYFSVGGKYYLNNFIEYLELPEKMYGTYAGIGLGRLAIDITDDGYLDFNTGETGTGTGSVGINMLQLKIGKRWFWGPITVNIESGYGLGKMDEEIEVKVEYQSFSETETYDTGDVPITSGAIWAFSIGLAL